MINLAIGDKIAYSVHFLRSIGETPTGPLCHARGKITEIKKYGANFNLAAIAWENNFDNLFPEKVNVCNLAKVGPNDRFCAC